MTNVVTGKGVLWRTHLRVGADSIPRALAFPARGQHRAARTRSLSPRGGATMQRVTHASQHALGQNNTSFSITDSTGTDVVPSRSACVFPDSNLFSAQQLLKSQGRQQTDSLKRENNRHHRAGLFMTVVMPAMWVPLCRPPTRGRR